MEHLQNKVAFITGGANGIGLALANIFVAEGMRVVLTDIDKQALDKAAAQFSAESCLAIQLDVTDRAGWLQARNTALQRFGAIDVLANNAGVGPDQQELADMQPASFDRVIAINLTGVFNGIATFGDDLRQQRSGHIVNTASTAGLIADARLGAYAAAKFAVVGMSELLRAEMQPHNVGVTVFCPGLTYTRLTAPAIDKKLIPASAAMDATVAARFVLQAIRENQLYALSHASYKNRVVERFEKLLKAFDSLQ